jgi:RNA polymerase sigma-70 factor (ECF subfamily)
VAIGDENAFRAIFDKYRPKVYAYAYSLTRSEVTAEEITQEVFLKMWENREMLPEIQHFSAWVKTVSRNAVYSLFRRSSTEKRILDEISRDASPSPSPTILEHKELDAQLRSALASLTEQQRMIFKLSREADMSYAEIANLLKISPNTVKYHMVRIFRHLRTHLGPSFLLLPLVKYFFE